MAGELKILQIGTENWSKYQEVPENMDWFFFYPDSVTAIRKVMKMEYLRSFHIVLVENPNIVKDLEALERSVEPYTLFYNQEISLKVDEQAYLDKMGAFSVDFSDREELLTLLSKVVFRGQYGDKQFPFHISIHPSFKGQVKYYGHEGVEVEGEFGTEFRPLANWRYNIIAYGGRPIELWLEYEKYGACDLQLVIRQIYEGSIADISETRIVSSEELEGPIFIDVPDNRYLCISLYIRGSGYLKIGNLHQRFSRFQFGKFVLGGGMISDNKRQEITYFFHPGDFKPPLSVYFSGYRGAEGFEGYNMMKGLGTPFLLFSDPRLQGGAFYLGSKELENQVIQVIQDSLNRLGFNSNQLIMSGMSMGSLPSMYYGAEFEPAAIIMSKSLANAGTIAQRNRLEAPGILDAWVDVLRLQTGGVEPENIVSLNQKFWDKFRSADFSKTTFGISYMKDEDMDPTAFDDIVKALYHTGAKILRKGTAGRHNDDTDTTVIWFMNFYRMILETQFGRK